MKTLINLKYILLLVVSLFLAGCPPCPVTILTPADGDHFEVGELIIFTGFARDFKDGELSGDSLVWKSSIDDEIGKGLIVNRNDLSEGTHTITLTATNSLEKKGTATITITIGEETPTTTTTTAIIPTPTTTPTTTSTTITDISGVLEIDKISGPLGVPMEAEVLIPFHVEGTEIVGEGGPWQTPISGDDVPIPNAPCTVDFTGEFAIQNFRGVLRTDWFEEPHLHFYWSVYETEYWTRTCIPGGTDEGDYTPPVWESEYLFPLVDGATGDCGPGNRFCYTLHLDSTP